MYTTDPPILDPLLTAEQVAERLSCSKSQAYAMMRRKAFPVVRMDRMIRVKLSSLEAYIEKQMVNPTEYKFVSRCNSSRDTHGDTNGRQ